ncbi:MAG: alpha-ribazole phosphatase family protein [Gammaproteobacteria bacterium]|nr:alpha-ribazole phosphatase family protein [Gammaproteobacteria bacterium]
MSDNNFTTIDLLRHGEVQGGPCYRGALDDPLTEKGWQQMLLATNNQSWDAVVSSPLCRCASFAHHLSPKVHIHHKLKEIDFGDWEGKTAKQLMKLSPDIFNNFMNDPNKNTPPNGEKLSSFKNRVINEWNIIVKQHQLKHILIVSHGGAMRTIISHILNIPSSNMMRLEIAHASMSRIRVYHDAEQMFPSLVFHGKALND